MVSVLWARRFDQTAREITQFFRVLASRKEMVTVTISFSFGFLVNTPGIQVCLPRFQEGISGKIPLYLLLNAFPRCDALGLTPNFGYFLIKQLSQLVRDSNLLLPLLFRLLGQRIRLLVFDRQSSSG